MKKFIEAVYHLFFFKKGYTTLDRWFEVAAGVISWGCVLMIIYIIIF